MKNFNETIHHFNETNFFEFLYKLGINKNDTKSLIIEYFQDYFKNKYNLKKYAIDNLVSIWFSYLTIQKNHEDTLKSIEIILQIFNSSKKHNIELTFDAYCKWYPEFSQSITRFWSIHHRQQEYDNLCNEDFLSEILQLIGQIIEGLIKPFLQFILYLNRLNRNKFTEIDEVKNKDLGVIIDELITTSDLKDYLIINNLKLNQWRNIAYHHNTKIINGRMYYYLKNNNIITEFETSRKELDSTAKLIFNLLKLIRISETIFLFDNFDEIKKHALVMDMSQVNFRKETELLNFTHSINSQGFKISNLEYDENLAILDLTDLESYSDIAKKAAHSSQILYNLYILTESKHLKLSYYLHDGIKVLTSEIIFSDVKKIKSLHEIIKNIKITYININLQQNINPFRDLSYYEGIVNNCDLIFYSQKGKKISLNKFSKKFIQSIFCNYLVLKEEGFDNIKINIGCDGATVIGQSPMRIVYIVPAKIDNKILQISLIKLLNKVIELYDKKLLSLDIVNESKRNNNYYRKLKFIENQKKRLQQN